MPFKSRAQRSFLYAKHPDLARRWTKQYGSGGTALPKRLSATKESDMISGHKKLLLGKGDTWGSTAGPEACPSCNKIGTHSFQCPKDTPNQPWGSWKKPTTQKESEDPMTDIRKRFKIFREELGAYTPVAGKEVAWAKIHSPVAKTNRTNQKELTDKVTHTEPKSGRPGDRAVLKQGTSDLPDKSGFKGAQTPVTFAFKRGGELKPLRLSPSSVKSQGETRDK